MCNDVSERAFQTERQGQWTKGKSADHFGPIGPWLVTRDEVADPQKLPMWLTVNGEKRQDGSTRTMVYGVAHLVSYLSQFMSLEPGDIISTGTPPGVGMGMKPPTYLKAGDVVELGIEGLGSSGRSASTIPTDARWCRCSTRTSTCSTRTGSATPGPSGLPALAGRAFTLDDYRRR